MKARMEVTLDTIWTNQVLCSVECELDNPHTLTAQFLSELMVQRLKYMAEEVRAADKRTAADESTLADLQDVRGSVHASVTTTTGQAEREREAFEEMRQARGDEQSLRENGEAANR